MEKKSKYVNFSNFKRLLALGSLILGGFGLYETIKYIFLKKNNQLSSNESDSDTKENLPNKPKEELDSGKNKINLNSEEGKNLIC